MSLPALFLIFSLGPLLAKPNEARDKGASCGPHMSVSWEGEKGGDGWGVDLEGQMKISGDPAYLI